MVLGPGAYEIAIGANSFAAGDTGGGGVLAGDANYAFAATVSVVPEPELSMLAAAGAGLLLIRRQRR